MEKDEKIALLTELLIDTQKKALETEKKALQELTTIRKWVTLFGVLTIISLIGGVIAAMVALSH
ncbi:MAG: hypothetical protein UFA98_01375 [Ruminococcus sp.]|nr:hypothetical protein [Ruminococcus sp.]